jgi:hypothetical protein
MGSYGKTPANVYSTSLNAGIITLHQWLFSGHHLKTDELEDELGYIFAPEKRSFKAIKG